MPINAFSNSSVLSSLVPLREANSRNNSDGNQYSRAYGEASNGARGGSKEIDMEKSLANISFLEYAGRHQTPLQNARRPPSGHREVERQQRQETNATKPRSAAGTNKPTVAPAAGLYTPRDTSFEQLLRDTNEMVASERLRTPPSIQQQPHYQQQQQQQQVQSPPRYVDEKGYVMKDVTNFEPPPFVAGSQGNSGYLSSEETGMPHNRIIIRRGSDGAEVESGTSRPTSRSHLPPQANTSGKRWDTSSNAIQATIQTLSRKGAAEAMNSVEYD